MFVYFTMAQSRWNLARHSININAVVGALSKKLRVVAFEMTDQVDSLH